MISNTNRKVGIRWWAAIGAPVIGIPILVGILAVAAPKDGQSAEVVEPVVVESLVHSDGVSAGEGDVGSLDGGAEPVSFDG